ncbi:hypothetical protein C8F01DRAFT_1090448 [Mycena amicta]|nr:hypothetical protein C8F01DRAFT_1090448 [Mycena amicta]
MSSSSALSLEFREPHLDAEAGLDAIPPAVRGITFDFDGFPVTSIRRFAQTPKCIVLWSPNSYQEPLCPGAPLSGLPPLQPSWELRRRDGSRGRYDCFIIPQLVSNVHPYLALVLRASQVPTSDEWYPAYGFPAQFWEDVPGRLDAATGFILGRMSASWRSSIRRLAEGLQKDLQAWIASLGYTDKTRLSNLPHTLGIPPKFDAAHTTYLLNRLEEGCLWDDGLERVVELQYDLPKGRIAETRSGTGLHRTIRLPANDDYVGFWVNGCSEETTMLLMNLGAPAFVVHTRPMREGEAMEQPSAWLQGSTTFNDHFVLHASSAIIGPSVPSEEIPTTRWPYPAFPLHGQLGNTSPSRALDPQGAVLAVPLRTIISLDHEPLLSSVPDDLEPIPTSEGTAINLEPLIDAATGRWTHWMEMEDPDVDDKVFFASTSKTNVEHDGQRVVYDRRNRRQLLMDDFAYPSGTFDPDLYGFQLPERVFRQRRNNGWKIVEPPSTWAYHSMFVPKELRHKIGTMPIPQQTQAPAPSRKGKQAARVLSPTQSRSPSEVSLGPPEEEEPEFKLFPTRCLRVLNLQLSAVNLAALVRSDEGLERASVFLKEVIVGQGATWMCFDDEVSPGLIWNWLEHLHQDVRVEIVSREGFDDASRYSHDRWDESFVEVTPAPRAGLQERTSGLNHAAVVPLFSRPRRWDGFVGHDEPEWGAGSNWGNPANQWGPPAWNRATSPRGAYDRYVSAFTFPLSGSEDPSLFPVALPEIQDTSISVAKKIPTISQLLPTTVAIKARAVSVAEVPVVREGRVGTTQTRESRHRKPSKEPASPWTRPDGQPSRAVSPATIERRWGLPEGTLREDPIDPYSNAQAGTLVGNAVDDRLLGERLRWIPQPPKPASLNPKKRSKPRGKSSGKDRQKRRNVKSNHEALRAIGLEPPRRLILRVRAAEEMDVDDEERTGSDEDMEEKDAVTSRYTFDLISHVVNDNLYVQREPRPGWTPCLPEYASNCSRWSPHIGTKTPFSFTTTMAVDALSRAVSTLRHITRLRQPRSSPRIPTRRPYGTASPDIDEQHHTGACFSGSVLRPRKWKEAHTAALSEPADDLGGFFSEGSSRPCSNGRDTPVSTSALTQFCVPCLSDFMSSSQAAGMSHNVGQVSHPRRLSVPLETIRLLGRLARRVGHGSGTGSNCFDPAPDPSIPDSARI